jgi:hypothetical protein
MRLGYTLLAIRRTWNAMEGVGLRILFEEEILQT